MPPKPAPDLKIAAALAKPFTAGKGRASAPLSFRILPGGGMVVITSDGRKLWFTADEVAAARAEMGMSAPTNSTSPSPARQTSRFRPTGLLPRETKPRSYDGMPTLMVFPPKRDKPK